MPHFSPRAVCASCHQISHRSRLRKLWRWRTRWRPLLQWSSLQFAYFLSSECLLICRLRPRRYVLVPNNNPQIHAQKERSGFESMSILCFSYDLAWSQSWWEPAGRGIFVNEFAHDRHCVGNAHLSYCACTQTDCHKRKTSTSSVTFQLGLMDKGLDFQTWLYVLSTCKLLYLFFCVNSFLLKLNDLCIIDIITLYRYFISKVFFCKIVFHSSQKTVTWLYSFVFELIITILYMTSWTLLLKSVMGL